MDSIGTNLQDIHRRLLKLGAPGFTPLTLIAVSKTQPISAILAAASHGQIDFGENYVQEGVDKIAAIKPNHRQLIWHMIGPIQSNKTRAVAESFDWVHTIDRLKIAQRLSEQRPTTHPPLQVLIQINIDHEPSKSGVLPSDALALVKAVDALPSLKLRGLMCIPDQASSQSFARMARLLHDINAQGFDLDVLSMGMSGDFEAAIAQGATHVRVGSAIFGDRPSTV
jgi:PLP dependent protein